MKVASTKLTNPEWEAVQDLCNSKGLTIAEYLRQLIQEDAEGLKESETHDAKEKPSPLFQLLRKQKSNNTKGDESNVDADAEDDGFPPSPSSKLPSEVAAIRQELANYTYAMRETSAQLAGMKKDLEKKKSESVHSMNQKMRCMSSDEGPLRNYVRRYVSLVFAVQRMYRPILLF